MLLMFLATTWKLFIPEIFGDAVSRNSVKYSRSYRVSKLGQKWIFHVLWWYHPKSILRDENKFFAPRGDLVRHFSLLLGFTSNRWGSRQKEISDQAHPLPCQTEKIENADFGKKYRKQNLIFEIVAEICDRECCRNFWQHDGNNVLPECPKMQFFEILYIIRRVMNVYFFLKKLKFLKMSRIFDFEIFWKNFGFCVIQKFIIWYEKYHDMIL